MFKIKSRSSGQSIFEIVIALGMFAMIAAAAAVLIMSGIELTTRSGQLIQAKSYLEEGAEAIRSIKNRAWDEMVYDRSGLREEADGYYLSGEGTADNNGLFSRTIDFYPLYRNDSGEPSIEPAEGYWLDILSKRIVINVFWDIGNGNNSNIAETLYFTDWQAIEWEQNDWLDGDGQAIWSNSARFKSSDGNINVDISGELTLLEIATSTFAPSGYLESSAFDTNKTANFAALIWEEEIPDDCTDCQIKFQIKTAADDDGWPGVWQDTWCGPAGVDDDEDDFFTQRSGELINSSLNGKQWIKYKAVLVGDGLQTPKLKSVKIFYQ